MPYCANCQKMFDEPLCPDCGSLGRTPQPGDWCLLEEQPKMFAQMLSDVLEQNGIPSACTSTQGGTGLFSNMNMEMYRVFVPWSEMERARLLSGELFSADPAAADAEEDGPESGAGETEEEEEEEP